MMSKPSNPFILPDLAEGEIVYPESRMKGAATLAAHYIASRAACDAELSHHFDSDISAFLSEDFGPDDREEKVFFLTRFAAVIDQCDAEYPLDYHRAWLKCNPVDAGRTAPEFLIGLLEQAAEITLDGDQKQALIGVAADLPDGATMRDLADALKAKEAATLGITPEQYEALTPLFKAIQRMQVEGVHAGLFT